MAALVARSSVRAAVGTVLFVASLAIYPLGMELLNQQPANINSLDRKGSGLFKIAQVRDLAAAPAGREFVTAQQNLGLHPSVGDTNCEVIHLVVQCIGTKGARETALLIKSILIHRSALVHFHFLADRMAHVILEKLLRTWNISGVYFSFYNLTEIQLSEDLKGLEVLQLHVILPNTIQRVIVMSTDTILNTDLKKAWNLFEVFDKFQHIGAMIENGTVNPCVLLLDLHYFRRKMPPQPKKLNIPKGQLSGNDDFLKAALNGMMELQPLLFFQIPCQWSYDPSDAQPSCPGAISGKSTITLLHRKTNGLPADDWQVYIWVSDYNGNQLRNSLLPGSRGDMSDNDVSVLSEHLVDLASKYVNPICSDYTKEFVGVFRIHPYYIELSYDPNSKNDNGQHVTLVTQVSISRVSAVEKLCEVWPGPVSVAVYLKDSDVRHFESYVLRSKIFSRRKDIAFHLVYQEWSQYPTNHLRNVAAEFVRTSHAFLLDADFMPVEGIYSILMHALDKLNNYPAKTTFVIPAFESEATSHAISVPKSRDEMIKLWDQGIFFQFRLKVYKEGHRATNYTTWRNATAPYQIRWEYGYEPYLVMASKDIPHYNERFMGYGGDKVSHVMEVAAMGYSFYVLPDAFIIHMPHGVSFDSIRFRSSMPMMNCLKVLLEDFGKELLTAYGNNSLYGWKPTIIPPVAAHS